MKIMPKSNEPLNKDLFDFLDARGFDPVSLDSSGEEVTVPEDAEVFQFHYRENEIDHGTVTVTIDGLQRLSIYFNDQVFDSASTDDFTKFISNLKKFAQKNQLGFQTKNMSKLGNDMRRKSHSKKIDEGYYGTRNTSYADNSPKSIKLIIKHSKPLDETDQRFRYVEKIFLENELGERLLVPTKKPSEGRVFARHLAEGGQYNDERWKHIVEMTTDIANLGGFVRATKTNSFTESVMSAVTEATQHYFKLKETIKRLQSSRGYSSYFETWQPSLMEQGTTDNLASIFTTSKLDPRIERAIPTLQRMNIRVHDMSETAQFEQWADSIINERLKPSIPNQVQDLVSMLSDNGEKFPVGADAMNAIGKLEGTIEDDELYDRLEKAAAANPDNDAKSIIISWMTEHSDDKIYSEVLEKINQGDDVSTQEEPAPEPEQTTPPDQAVVPEPSAGSTPPLAEKKSTANKPPQRNFVAKHAQRSGAGAHGKQGYQRHPKHKSKLGEEDVAEAKPSEESTRWRVEQSDATGRYHIVKGYQKRKVWKNSFGSGDFISKDAAQKKADELNGGVEEGRVQQLPTRGADYSKYDTDHLKMMLRPGILHRDEAKFKALIRKELQKREQHGQQGVAEGSLSEFAKGEGGFGPFKLYKGSNYKMHEIGSYDTLKQAEEELEIQKDLDTDEGVVSYFKIEDGTGEQVGGFDPDDVYDNMRSGRKIQFRKPGEQDVAEEQISEMNPMLVRDGLQVVIDFLSQYPQATALTAGAAGAAIVAKLVKNAWRNHKELEQLKQDVRDWSIQKLHSNKNVSAEGGKVAKIIQTEIERRKQDMAEGSTSKEKQKRKFRDINSPEYRAAADEQRKKMAQDQAAEPGKKLLDKIAKKEVSEDFSQLLRIKKLSGLS
jgi:hypothetical protein